MSCLDYLDKKMIKINELNKRTIDHIEKNKISIILNSEETDICRSYALYLLYWLTRAENAGKNAFIVAFNYEKALNIKKDLLELCKRIFLPVNEKEKILEFKNGANVYFVKLHKNNVLKNRRIDLVFSMDIAETSNYVFLNMYKEIYQDLMGKPESQLVINSYPNGFNMFHKLFDDAENGKNNMASLRLYYWEDNKKNGDWVKEKINLMGEAVFNQKYNLLFSPVKSERKRIKNLES